MTHAPAGATGSNCSHASRGLNRVEYQNTLNDLFAVDVDIQDLLPDDAVAFGFDNVGAALNVSPTLIERYVAAIDKVLDATVARPAASKKVELYSFPGGFKGIVKERGIQDICQCKERRDTGEIVLFGDAAGSRSVARWRTAPSRG